MPVEPAPPEPLQIFLLMGQSNMAGRGEVADVDRTPHERVWSLGQQDAWEPAVEPLHWDRPGHVGTGPGLSFAKSIARAMPDWHVGLVPCAVGATELARWQKGADLYARALDRAATARRAGTLRGVLWHQGECDCDPALADSYGQRLTEMIQQFRGELGCGPLPWVVGTLGDFLAENPDYAAVEPVQDALRMVRHELVNVALADAAGLADRGDLLHFSAESYRELGLRYAAQMLRLIRLEHTAG